MIKQNIKYLLWISLFFLVFILFNAWNNEKELLDKLDDSKLIIDRSNFSDNLQNFDFNDVDFNDDINVSTNLVDAKINLSTGDICYISLKRYFNSTDSRDNVVILNKVGDNFYHTRSGIIFNKNIDIFLDKSNFFKISYSIRDNDLSSIVILRYITNNNFIFYKVYTFKTYSYDVDIDFYIYNDGYTESTFKHYGFINYKGIKSESGFLGSGITSYKGGAVFNVDKPYKKLSFNDLNSKSYSYIGNGGWIAFVERYFISAFIPDVLNDYLYVAEKLSNNIYVFKFISNTDITLSSKNWCHLNTHLFVGPKTSDFLNNLPKGLDLTIDYGVFWPIASPIFFLLNLIYAFLNNWGFSIIFITFLIKLVFFNLSSISYKSMSAMKKLQPRLDLLKEQYKDDKTQFGAAVINLYKKESINPFSGCLPVILQIPVFISLYYVLLESIELRQAHFFYWITDLSNKDPYYVLPIIMSITMFVQQKLNPPIQDPIQSKVMAFLPLIFLFIFLQFPAGLVLYWIVNNILSILQQWIIMRR